MKNKFRNRNNKGEKMSLRKITTLLLLAAFALTQVPVQAANLTVTGALPSAVVDAGSLANGANRDVVPVSLSIDTSSASEVFFGTYTGTGTFAITENGNLTVTGPTIVPATSTKVLVIEPPVGAEFVGLDGYVSNVVTATMNPAAGGNTGSLINVSSGNLPGTGSEDTAILAKIITETGSAATFGSTVPAGSIVVYTVTNSGTNTSINESDIVFNNIGLAIPAGSSLTTAQASYKEVIIGTSVNEAVNLVDGAIVTVANVTTDANGQIAVGLDTTEPDNQSNAVLADLLAASSNTVKVNTNAITTNTVNATTLNVDTDALLIQAGETPASTVGTPVYYDTPFNTSSFLSSVANGGSASILNAALTSASFPNSANALITVTYSLVPLTGNGSTDATLVLDAASVALSDLGTSQGYLGSLINAPLDVNGGALTAANFAVSVLYNGASTSANLDVEDFDLLNDATTNVTTTATAVGFNFATANFVPVASASAATFVNATGNLVSGVFPGVTVAQADAITTTPRIVNNGNYLTNVVNTAAGFTVSGAPEDIWVADEVNVRLRPTGGNAIFAFTGNEAGDDLSDDVNDVKIGPTNFGIVPYNQGATLASGEGPVAASKVRNNAIMVARLSGNAVQIMPLVNKVDSARDVIKVRPEATITLGATSKAQGLRLIATVTGNNIAGSKVVEIARINAAGSTDIDATVRSLPASGELDSLLAENGTDASTLRVAIDPGTITNVTTNDEIADLIANGSVLDDTLPSFFCGGTAGTLTNGPNAVPQQPYARAILVEETTAGAFDDAFVGGGNDVIRFTLPVGVDLIKTSATANANDVAVISTDGGAVGTFATTPDVVKYQSISENNGGQAYIDVSYSASVAGDTTVKKAVGLIFGSYSLVIPEGQTDFDVTVTVVNDDGTTSTASDTVLDTIGTAPLATGCATQFTISYCDDALANFGSASGPVEQNQIDNGSLLTSFSNTVSSGVRLLNNTATAFRIPDICVAEAVPDAFFAGASATTPNIFGPGQNVSLALSDPGDETANSFNIGFAAAGSIDQSDDSLTFAGLGLGGGLVNATVNIGTGTDEFLETTTVRFAGITLNETTSNFQPAVQSITVFTNDGTDHIATSMPSGYETRGANGTALTTVTDARVQEILNVFFNGDDIANNTATLDADSGDFSNGQFLGFAFAGNSAKLANAVVLVNDSASAYQQLSDDTKLSIAVDAIDAVTNGLAAYTRITVFTSAAELEPGSMINISASSGDSVNVPVQDDGNFMAMLRGEQGDTLVITQTPTSDLATADQQVVVTANDQNLTPTLISAVASDLGFGTVTAKGTVPVVFTLTAVGRVNGSTFVPTADQLTVSGNPVYAVPGTKNKFMSIINFFQTDGTSVKATVDGNETSVKISGLTTDFPTLGGRPVLKNAVQKTKKKSGETRVIFKGSRLRNNGFGYFVNQDGTVEQVTFRKRTRNDRSKNRVVSESADTVPSNVRYALYHTPGRGISTVDLSQ
jgi:hypothetical protein